MIYLDANAGVPAGIEALAAYRDAVGSPSSSAKNTPGRAPQEHLEECRRLIAGALGAEAEEVVLTSGGTEADALAILGSLGPSGDHVVTTAIEHPAVKANLEALREAGRIELTVVPAGRDGRVSPREVLAAVNDRTRLVSVIAASNETGVIQPVAEIAQALKGTSVRVHTDAVQAVHKSPVDFRSWGVDLLSLSGHKFGAVAGVGALLVRRGLSLAPILGDGEGGHHGDAENLPGAASLAAALGSAYDAQGVAEMRDALETALLAGAAEMGIEVQILGGGVARLPNTSCVRFVGCEGDAVMMALDVRGVAVSTGSACSSGSIEPSAVLLGMGLLPQEAKEAVRFSLLPTTTHMEIDEVVAHTLDVLRLVSVSGESL